MDHARIMFPRDGEGEAHIALYICRLPGLIPMSLDLGFPLNNHGDMSGTGFLAAKQALHSRM